MPLGGACPFHRVVGAVFATIAVLTLLSRPLGILGTVNTVLHRQESSLLPKTSHAVYSYQKEGLSSLANAPSVVGIEPTSTASYHPTDLRTFSACRCRVVPVLHKLGALRPRVNCPSLLMVGLACSVCFTDTRWGY